MMKVEGNIVDIIHKKIFPGIIFVDKGHIIKIEKSSKKFSQYIVPGLIDAHIHIESSMLPPSEFARLAVCHGTVATVSDSHEIANVLGSEGINYMIENGKKVPFKFYFGASSCVPATSFETSGATLSHTEIEKLLKRKEIKYLSEMMNYPGVIFKNKEVLKKIALAKKYKKPIDGHAPGVMGSMLKKYVSAGISTDHETYLKEEALQKIKLGMKIQIREGSAAKNFDTLSFLIKKYPQMCMFCSDDRHPDDLVKEHINNHVKRALKKNNIFEVLKIATLNPVKHYNLDVGLLQKNDPADFIIVDNLKNFRILQTYINGQLVAKTGKSLIKKIKPQIKNNFHVRPKILKDISTKIPTQKTDVIGAINGQLITEHLHKIPNSKNDILKIVVVNRYKNSKPAISYIKNFGLKKGAIASSVAHDSHNIVAVGVTDKEILKAINAVIENKGGLAVATKTTIHTLPLKIAGLMSNEDGYKVAKKYSKLNSLVKLLGSKLHAPFMTLSFMALLVIPKLKLSDKGLFDSEKFSFIKN